MQLDTTRFGLIEINDEKIIAFPDGIPGFEEIRRFVVIETPNTRPIYWLQAIDDHAIALPVINPFEVLEEYSPTILENDIQELGVEAPEDLLVFNVLVIPADITRMTVNLAAPILVNVRRSCGRQILIDGKEYTVRHAVFADIYRLLQKESEKIDAGTNAQG